MTDFIANFDATSVEPAESREPIPAGWYKCVITDAINKPTKAQTGSYMELKVQVIEGQHNGRTVYERLNLDNPNDVAVSIAQRTLSAICHAVGVLRPTDKSQLYDKPMMVKVVVKPASGDYSANNEIKEYATIDGGQPNSAPPAAYREPTPMASSTPPWRR